jgi:hypothetical protein
MEVLAVSSRDQFSGGLLLLMARASQILIALGTAGSVLVATVRGHAGAWAVPMLIVAVGCLERLERRLAGGTHR